VCTQHVARYTIKRTLCAHKEDPRPKYRYRASGIPSTVVLRLTTVLLVLTA